MMTAVKVQLQKLVADQFENWHRLLQKGKKKKN
jgi:hypothetical protein